MAKDVAHRELDQAGHRISNLGDPKAAGDATKTDNSSKPKPASGNGSPGTSLLAAPADHVHPASEGGGGGGATIITLEDPTQQSVKGSDLELVREFLVDFDEVPASRLSVAFGAVVKVSEGSAKLKVLIGGDPGKPEGKEVARFETDEREFTVKGTVSKEDIENPDERKLVKIVAATEKSDAVCTIRTKTIQIRGR